MKDTSKVFRILKTTLPIPLRVKKVKKMFLKICSYSARLATMETEIGISGAIRNATLNLLRNQASELAHKKSTSPWKKGWALRLPGG